MNSIIDKAVERFCALAEEQAGGVQESPGELPEPICIPVADHTVPGFGVGEVVPIPAVSEHQTADFHLAVNGF